MSRALAFWILMLIWLIFGVWTSYPNYQLVGGNLMLFVLLVLVGWQCFDAPIHG